MGDGDWIRRGGGISLYLAAGLAEVERTIQVSRWMITVVGSGRLMACVTEDRGRLGGEEGVGLFIKTQPAAQSGLCRSLPGTALGPGGRERWAGFGLWARCTRGPRAKQKRPRDGSSFPPIFNLLRRDLSGGAPCGAGGGEGPAGWGLARGSPPKHPRARGDLESIRGAGPCGPTHSLSGCPGPVVFRCGGPLWRGGLSSIAGGWGVGQGWGPLAGRGDSARRRSAGPPLWAQSCALAQQGYPLWARGAGGGAAPPPMRGGPRAPRHAGMGAGVSRGGCGGGAPARGGAWGPQGGGAMRGATGAWRRLGGVAAPWVWVGGGPRGACRGGVLWLSGAGLWSCVASPGGRGWATLRGVGAPPHHRRLPSHPRWGATSLRARARPPAVGAGAPVRGRGCWGPPRGRQSGCASGCGRGAGRGCRGCGPFSRCFPTQSVGGVWCGLAWLVGLVAGGGGRGAPRWAPPSVGSVAPLGRAVLLWSRVGRPASTPCHSAGRPVRRTPPSAFSVCPVGRDWWAGPLPRSPGCAVPGSWFGLAWAAARAGRCFRAAPRPNAVRRSLSVKVGGGRPPASSSRCSEQLRREIGHARVTRHSCTGRSLMGTAIGHFNVADLVLLKAVFAAHAK